MKKSEWLGGEDRSPAVWIGPDGKGHISELAFSMSDDAGRQMLFEQAKALEAEHVELRKSAPADAPTSKALEINVSSPLDRALARSADRLVFALLEFAEIVRNARDEDAPDRGAIRALLGKE